MKADNGYLLFPNSDFTEYAKSIAVYDVEDKKLVLIFSSITNCTKYLGICKSLSKAIKTKIRSKNKKFKRTICYRYANPEQAEMLGTNPMICLDERFQTKEPIKFKSEFRHKEKLENQQESLSHGKGIRKTRG